MTASRSGSAQWGAYGCSGNRAAERDPIARATCAKEEAACASGNRSTDGVSNVQATRAARPARPFGQPDGGDVPLCECTVPPCGFISRETGRRSKAGSAGAPCSEVARARVRATESGRRRLHGAGDPCMRSVSSAGQPAGEIGFRVWATRAVGSSDPAGNRESERVHGFGVHEWGPPSRLGNWAARRASRNRGTDFSRSRSSRRKLCGERGRGPTPSPGNRVRGACTRQTFGPGNRDGRAWTRQTLRSCNRQERACFEELDARATVRRESGRGGPNSRGTVGRAPA